MRAAVREVFGEVPVQRCQWHKRENVVSYLAKQDQPTWRRKLQAAYAHPTYADAKRALERLYRELRLTNESAAASLAEGLEETLTLHRLNVFPELGVSFKTTNLIESVMARLRGNDTACHPMADERSAAAVVRLSDDSDGAPVSSGKTSPPSALAEAGTPEQTLTHELRSGMKPHTTTSPQFQLTRDILGLLMTDRERTELAGILARVRKSPGVA